MNTHPALRFVKNIRKLQTTGAVGLSVMRAAAEVFKPCVEPSGEIIPINTDKLEELHNMLIDMTIDNAEGVRQMLGHDNFMDLVRITFGTIS